VASTGDDFCTVARVKERSTPVDEKGGQDMLVAGRMKVFWEKNEQRARETAQAFRTMH
jgi:hypothetical protein